ncbi:hypothetical protein CDL60_23340 [Roseateles noduli]|nr:hypothetical protein CDL60_23340 [Roseateles noduli]
MPQRKTVIDQALYQRALAVADQPVEERDLINAALRAFIARQAQFRLADMGGTAPDLPNVPRRRPSLNAPEGWE